MVFAHVVFGAGLAEFVEGHAEIMHKLAVEQAAAEELKSPKKLNLAKKPSAADVKSPAGKAGAKSGSATPSAAEGKAGAAVASPAGKGGKAADGGYFRLFRYSKF